MLFIFLAVALTAAGCPSGCTLRDMAQSAQRRVRQSIEASAKVRPPMVIRDPRPRLAVDVSLSMAGYIAPQGKPVTEFNRALEAVASRLAEHDLFAFGLSGVQGKASLADLLVPQTGGVGQAFATDEIFHGPNNQDDLLYQAVGREDKTRPLVLFTDGVYSSPSGNGIEPVMRALDELLQKGWSLGFIALRSAYYGTRREHISGRPLNGERFFYSEASTQRRGPGFIPMPCPVLRHRPFYVIVLSPTSNLFDDLYTALKESFGAEGFLLGGAGSPVVLGNRIAPVNPQNRYHSDDSLRWLMLNRETDPATAVRIPYSIDRRFPVDSLAWTVEADQISWQGSGFSPTWKPVDSATLKPESDEGRDGETDSAEPAQRLPSRSFKRDVENLRTAFDGQIEAMGDLESKHRDAVSAVRQWRPDEKELSELYCEYLDQPSPREPSTPLSILRVLLAADALRHQQRGELSLSLAPSGSIDGELTALANDLVGSVDGGAPHHTTLAPAMERTVPAGRPRAADRTETESKAPPSKTLKVSVVRRDWGTTYRLRLVPQPLRFSRKLRRWSTDDDSDLASADRTYRLANLVESLATAQLERDGAGGELTAYITVPGR